MIAREKQLRLKDIYLFDNHTSRVFACTPPFSMRRGLTPRLIVLFANLINTMIHWERCIAHDRRRMVRRCISGWWYYRTGITPRHFRMMV
jgi:hypothetical protein